MTKKPELSIVLVSFNTKSLTLKCIKSIFEHTKGVTFEVIVVDNASKDGTVEALKHLSRKLPVKILPLEQNLGFGTGNNRGVQLAEGKYLLLLNTDTYLSTNALKICMDEVKNIGNLGAYTCQLLNKDGSVQPTGGYFPTLRNIFTWQFFVDDFPFVGQWLPRVHPKASFYTKQRELDWITGAFMLIPRRIYLQTGGFDESIFMYVEDTDLCFRLKKMGLKVIFSPSTQITHLGGASGSGTSLAFEAKQTVFFVRKHYGYTAGTIASTLIWFGSLLRLLLFGIIMGDETRALAYRQILSGIFT